MFGDAKQPPFAPGSFDAVVTPWLVDVVDTARFAGSNHRVTMEVKTDHADDNACGIDAFVPGGP